MVAVGVLLVLTMGGIWLAPHKSPLPRPAHTNAPAMTSSNAPDLSKPIAAPALPHLTPLERFPGWTNSPQARLIYALLDGALPLKARRQAAVELARIGSDEAIAALKTALLDGPPYLKAMIAEGLGESAHPEAEAMLLGLLRDPDEVVARGAIQGLATRGTAQAAQALQEVLFDATRPESVRTEAALALGDVPQPEALNALARALSEIDEPGMIESILEGLGKRPFEETESLFRSYLETPNLPSDMKAAALEALSSTQGDVSSFLLGFASDPDPEVRGTAIAALGNSENQSDLGPQLMGLLKDETDPDVRAKLYEALKNQDNLNAADLLAQVQAETASPARLAALNTLAAVLHTSDSEAARQYFDQVAVPELKNSALTAEDPDDRLEALASLRLAGTALSLQTIQDIAAHSTDPKIVQAAKAVPSQKPGQ